MNAIGDEDELAVMKEEYPFIKYNIDLSLLSSDTAIVEDDQNEISTDENQLLNTAEQSTTTICGGGGTKRSTRLSYHPGDGLSIACDICQKMFKSRSKMTWHRRMHDDNRQLYSCPHAGCSRVYASKQSCELHYKQTHLDEGYACTICHKLFAIPQTLEVHMRYHTRTFPFECSECNKKFAQKGHLTTHMQVKHHNLRYICTQPGCSKVFKNSMSLRNHRFVHTGMPFMCSFCDKGYPQKSKLKMHIRLKHNLQMSLNDLESMRQFKNPRTRHFFVKLETENCAEAAEEIHTEFDDSMVEEIEVI